MFGDKGNIITNTGKDWKNYCQGCPTISGAVNLTRPWERFIKKDDQMCQDFNIDTNIKMDTPNFKIKWKGPATANQREDWCSSVGMLNYSLLTINILLVIYSYLI